MICDAAYILVWTTTSTKKQMRSQRSLGVTCSTVSGTLSTARWLNRGSVHSSMSMKGRQRSQQSSGRAPSPSSRCATRTAVGMCKACTCMAAMHGAQRACLPCRVSNTCRCSQQARHVSAVMSHVLPPRLPCRWLMCWLSMLPSCVIRVGHALWTIARCAGHGATPFSIFHSSGHGSWGTLQL